MSGGSNNATIAIPGQNWEVLWPYQFDAFQLDIVGFLAVLGEGSILSISQVSALSRLFYLPRLLPAPQALLRPTRPTDLPPTNASVTAVFSGNFKDHLHHVASIILTPKEGGEMEAYTVRCVRITKEAKSTEPGNIFNRISQSAYFDRVFRGQGSQPKDKVKVCETTPEGKIIKTAVTSAPVEPAVKAKAAGPLTWVTLLGFFLSLSLFIISIVLGDGMSLLATILLSLLSTLIGFGNKWELAFAKRATNAANDDKNGDVVIRYPNGSYLIVRCEEDIARELFFAPEEIKYQVANPTYYRLIALVGTLMLMLGVIFLANAKLQLQFCWGGAYIILNAAHWAAAAIPQRRHWDLSRYKVREEGVETGPENSNFTEALFKAILFTKSKDWVRIGKQSAPVTTTWDQWLEEATQEAKKCESRINVIEKPAFKTERDKRGTVWDIPNQKIWRAKTAWNKIDARNKNPAEGHHDEKRPQPPEGV